MKTKRTKSSKQKEVVLSAAELSKFGVGVMSKALKIVNAAKQSKLTIRLEKE